VLQVNATTPLNDAQYTITFTVTSQNLSASPSSQQSNVTFIAASAGPYLLVEIIQYNSSVRIGDFINLKAKITNIGNETAVNAVANWTVPSGWTTIPSELNRSFATIAVNQFVYHNISADISSSASTGTKTISVYAEAPGAANNTASQSVTVTSSTPAPSDSDSGGGSGGSSSAASGGGGGLVFVSSDSYNVILDLPASIEIMANGRQTIEINLTNSQQDLLLENVSLSVDGFLLSRMNISPKVIPLIEYGQTKTFLLSLDVPQYYKYQNISLKISLKAKSRLINGPAAYSDFEKTSEITLVVLQVTRESALAGITGAVTDVSALNENGISLSFFDGLLSEAQEAMNAGNYEKAKELTDRISLLKDKAIQVNSLIGEAQSRIKSSLDKGFDVYEAQQFLSLAVSSFNEGNFDDAEELVKKALLSEGIASGYGESSMIRIALTFFQSNWQFILLSALIISAGGIFLRKSFWISSINERIKTLDKEEEIVMGMIRKAQEEYFKEKIIGERVYKKAMSQYTKRLTQVHKSRIRLTSRKITLLKKTNDYEALQKEKISLNSLMKEVQSKYFVSKIMDKDTYKSILGEYSLRESDIDKMLQMQPGKHFNESAVSLGEDKLAGKTEIVVTSVIDLISNESIASALKMLEQSIEKLNEFGAKGEDVEKYLEVYSRLSKKYIGKK
ncbi:MAG TPA: hypothetical protein VJI97_01630, partial [Candidatus Nanoarchaeia archaeon]|nr:hypothetical protein [Candidatus Nanoarchaeia archaeon]